MTLDEMLLEQQQAAKLAKQYSERDKELRAMIYGMAFAGLEDGKTHNSPLGNGYVLKGKRPVNYKVDADKADAALDELSALGNEGSFVADRIVKWEPKLSVSEYGKLTPAQRAIIDRVVTTTPGLPVIEIKEPSA